MAAEKCVYKSSNSPIVAVPAVNLPSCGSSEQFLKNLRYLNRQEIKTISKIQRNILGNIIVQISGLHVTVGKKRITYQ